MFFRVLFYFLFFLEARLYPYSITLSLGLYSRPCVNKFALGNVKKKGLNTNNDIIFYKMRSTAGNYQNSLGVREFSQKANHKTYMIFFPRDIRNIRISYVCVFFLLTNQLV